MFFRNKKGMEFVVIGLILLIAGATAILGFFGVSASRAEGSAAEELCRSTNVLYTQVDPTKDILPGRVTPQGCKVLAKSELPSPKYPQKKEGAMQNVADLMARCWRTFLEGTVSQPIGARGLFQPDDKAKCSVCYIFTLQTGMGFGAEELDNYISDSGVYTVIDDSDTCTISGGGRCKTDCSVQTQNDPDGVFTKAQSSTLCTQKKKGSQCCTAADECVNKGGKCLNGAQEPYTKKYGKWGCSEGACYIKTKNYITYKQYIQRVNGEGYTYIGDVDSEGNNNIRGSAGDTQLKSGEGYDIIFVSNVQKSFWQNTFKRQIGDILGTSTSYPVAGIIVVPSEKTKYVCHVQEGAGGE